MVAESARTIRIVRADGLRVDDHQPMLRFSIQVVVDDGTRSLAPWRAAAGERVSSISTRSARSFTPARGSNCADAPRRRRRPSR